MEKLILHVDCNSFFASVEQALNPALKNLPMSVAGDPEKRHGIILASNQLAKKEGVKTAEPIFAAKNKSPSLVLVAPHYEKYEEYSKKCFNIYSRFTDIIEPFGIDECWLDLTASKKLFGSGEEIGNKIRETIKNELGITVSVGVSFNKIFAKLGSDYKKPDALTIISKENFKDIVFPLPVNALLGVGRKITPVLNKLGIRTIGGLARYDRSVLIDSLGKAGAVLHNYANGLDDAKVDPEAYAISKSIGNGKTFSYDIESFEELYKHILNLTDTVGYRLRKHGFKTDLLKLTIKDTSFRTTTHQEKIPLTDISLTLAKDALSIIKKIWPKGESIRSLTITAGNLIKNNAVQYSLLDDRKLIHEEEELQKAIDTINKKYGKKTIKQGEQLK